MAEVTMDKIVSLCRRRGFIFQSSEIYGGLNGAYDYGPMGVELKNNIRDFWWKEMIQMHDNIVGLDASILMHPRVWEASGHVSNFTDPMVDCKVCHSRFRADQIDLNAPCPVCGNKTRIKIRSDTELINFPLFCPKCKQENLINVKQFMVKKRMIFVRRMSAALWSMCLVFKLSGPMA